MASTDVTDQNDREGDGFGCPIFKAYPHLWWNHKKCISYWANDLKGTLLRHHVIGWHEKINAKMSVDDARYLPPEVFDAIKRCKKDKRCANDATTWRIIYARVKGVNIEDAATQDPYWTPLNLYTTLHSTLSLLSASSNIRSGNDAIPWSCLNHQDKQAELRNMETKMIAEIENYAENCKEGIRSNCQQFAMRLATSGDEPVPAGSFSSSNQPGDSQSTNFAGTMFPDAESLEQLLDVEAQGNMSGHDNDIFHNSDYTHSGPFSAWNDKENSHVGPETTHEVYTSHQTSQRIASMSGNGSMDIDHTSSQATLAATPPRLPFFP